MRALLPALPLALLACMPIAAAAEREAAAGEVVRFEDGDVVTWRLAPEEDHALFVRAGDAPLQVRWLSAHGPGATTTEVAPTPQGGGPRGQPGALSPHGGFGTRLDLGAGGNVSLGFDGGGGWALVSSWRMAEEGSEGNGTVATLRHGGALAPGACAAQTFGDSSLGNVRTGRGVLRGPAVVEAGGPGVRFRLHDAAMRVLAESGDVLSHRLSDADLRAFESHHLHLQACAPADADGPLAYVLRVTRTAEPEEAQGRRVEVPAAGLPLALAALALAARARRR